MLSIYEAIEYYGPLEEILDEDGYTRRYLSDEARAYSITSCNEDELEETNWWLRTMADHAYIQAVSTRNNIITLSYEHVDEDDENRVRPVIRVNY